MTGASCRNRTCNLPLGGESYIHLTKEAQGLHKSVQRQAI